MTTSSRLTFHLEEPGEDPLSDDIFDILCRSLQPDPELSMEATIQKITALPPQGKLYSREMGVFLETCYEVAEQIPFAHASMTRLTTIIYSCHESIQTSGATRDEYPYQKLGETLRGWWDSSSTPTEDPSKYVNFQAFTAHLHARGMVTGHRVALWTLETALDTSKVVSQAERNAYVKAASNWLLLCGDEIHTGTTAQQWRGWHNRLKQVSDGKWRNQACTYDEETVLLAGKAVVAMEAVERKKDG
ncbi:unnamed protein product [Zymoseptoria tritici ST99CH_3D7]|uniref:Uncharacterized protein n=1 Tax=Zymoseptoria tritici (strain ST99CH_3D7) TaxID=1276538 RepID=A0A1X7RI39_ZYMT9|nr:unnamed protein product [Zymoseptoria tritici ST99CH_3D7]